MSKNRRSRDEKRTSRLPPAKKRKTNAGAPAGLGNHRGQGATCSTTLPRWDQEAAAEREERFQDYLDVLGAACLRIYRACTSSGSPPFLDAECERWPESLRPFDPCNGTVVNSDNSKADPSLDQAGHLAIAVRHLLAAKAARERYSNSNGAVSDGAFEERSLADALDRTARAFDQLSSCYVEASKIYKEMSSTRAGLVQDLAKWDEFKINYVAELMVAIDPTFCGGTSKATLEILVAQGTSTKRRAEALQRVRKENLEPEAVLGSEAALSPMAAMGGKLKRAREEKEDSFRAAEELFVSPQCNKRPGESFRKKDLSNFGKGRVRAKVRWEHVLHNKPLSEETWASKTTAKETGI